jgi:hypothetical protein
VAIGDVIGQVFATSNQLDDVSLQHLMQAICTVSENTLEVVGPAGVNTAVLQHQGCVRSA